jgi:hypothetical protein
MVTDKIAVKDLQNFAKGVLELTMPDYMACRSVMSMITYTKDTWRDGEKPSFTSTIDKETNTITVTLVK